MRYLHYTENLTGLKEEWIQSCGHAFAENAPFTNKYQRMTVGMKDTILEKLQSLISYKQIANHCKVGVGRIIRMIDTISYGRPQTLPTVLSIDEFKGNASGQKYQVILTDPINAQIIDILPRRDTQAMITYFQKFPYILRKKVKFITMDMSSQFRLVMRSLFPHACIVADRFHVFRNVEWAMERVRKAEQNRLLAKTRLFKSNKRLLRKPYRVLTSDEITRLEDIFRASPRIHTAYLLKETFNRVKDFKGQSRECVIEVLEQWLDIVKTANIPEFSSVLKTFTSWREEIINALIYPYSNGFTEGCNNKIKVLKRVSYGIRNFRRFRTRILFLNAERGHATLPVHVLSESA